MVRDVRRRDCRCGSEYRCCHVKKGEGRLGKRGEKVEVRVLSLLQGVSIFEACLVAQWPDYPLYVLLQIDKSPAGDFGESTLHLYIAQ